MTAIRFAFVKDPASNHDMLFSILELIVRSQIDKSNLKQ